MMESFKLILVSVVCLLTTMVFAQNGKMTVNLWENGAPNENGLQGTEKLENGYFLTNISKASMTVYPSSSPGSKAIIMCPGGGYVGECITYEGHDMAEWFHSIGVTYIVLKYRLPNGHPDVPLSDVHRAILLARAHCKEWHINPHSVGIMGASAGGHLAATAANFYSAETRPDFQILLYPVITMSSYTHAGSKENLLGKNPSEELIAHYSMERQVTDHTPRAFIVLANDDDVVSPLNSIRYYTALLNHHVSATLHIYPQGGHGFGFQDSFLYKRQWTGELEKWLLMF